MYLIKSEPASPLSLFSPLLFWYKLANISEESFRSAPRPCDDGDHGVFDDEEERGRSSTGSLHKEVDVAIIGNGPAGIFLSLLLSGHWPYFTGKHPNIYLKNKLSQQPDQSVIEQDLQFLSDGLEGRSNNSVSVLLDSLVRPNVDIGEDHPSSLRWVYNQSKAVPHVVLGRGKPGGVWHDMTAEIHSLSLGSWLELPGYRFNDWKLEFTDQQRCTAPRAHTNGERVSVGDIALYYSEYVPKMGLQSNFMSGVDVSLAVNCDRLYTSGCCPSVDSSPLSSISCSSQESSPDSSPIRKVFDFCINSRGTCSGEGIEGDLTKESDLLQSSMHLQFEKNQATIETNDSILSISDDEEICPSDSKALSLPCLNSPVAEDVGVYCSQAKQSKKCPKWILHGKCSDGDRAVIIAAKKVVLACGVGGNPKRLNVAGEDASFVCHRFSDLSPKLDSLADRRCSEPLLVVGAGLSAADAVLHALEKNFKVIHVFRQDPSNSNLIYRRMSAKLYHEYHYIWMLMQNKLTNENYTAFPRCDVSRFEHNGKVAIRSRDDSDTELVLRVQLAMVLIGSEAELGFLPQDIVSKLGLYSDMPIHYKNNPIDVDPISFECVNVPSLFALGPLVGDNFVRFALGSALGAAQSLAVKER